MSSFKSSENIQKKECGPDRSVSDFSCCMMRSRQDRGGKPNDSGSGHCYPQTEGCNLDTTTNYLEN